MDSFGAFARGEAARASGAKLMVFDWVKAAKIIKERQPEVAGAGLESDWDWTGGEIWRGGKPIPKKDTYTYLASIWATPQLDIDGEIIECFIMEEDTEWSAKTYWPAEALAIIEGE